MKIVKTFLIVALLSIGAYYYSQWKKGGVVPAYLLRTNLKGKTVLITGANTGIGLETSIELAKLGARVIVGSRSEQRANEAVKRIKQESSSEDVIFPAPLDLGSLDSVRNFVRVIKENKEDVSILINNAGVMGCPHDLTVDGYEIQFGTNHLGHFLLTKLLLNDLLKNKGRVVNVSSRASERLTSMDVLYNLKSPNKQLKAMDLYSQSKIANVIFTNELNNRYGDQGLVTYSLHPGVVSTELARHFHPALVTLGTYIGPYLLKTPLEGAQTNIYAALVDPKDVPSGSYLSDCAVRDQHPVAKIKCLQKEFWEISDKATEK